MRAYLKQLRETRGYTMQNVAEKLGITKQYYQYIEAGERQKRMDILLAKGLADILNVPLGMIIEEEAKWAKRDKMVVLREPKPSA